MTVDDLQKVLIADRTRCVMDFDRSTVAMGIGALLLVGAVVGGFCVFDSEYVHELETESAAFNASKDGHLRYANLSVRGQEIVDKTVERGTYVVESDDQTAPEFEYTTDYAQFGTGMYVIQHDDQAYEITTSRDGPGMGLGASVLSAVVLLPLAIVGSALLAFGASRRRNRSPDE
jgi:hypothetical protein